MAVKNISSRDRPDAGRRSRHDEVPRFQGEIAGRKTDDFRHLPDKLADVAFLPYFAVALSPPLSLVWVTLPRLSRLTKDAF